MNTITFWAFQLINMLSALGLFVAPRKFHESTFKNPSLVYARLGFSETALEMLHNVLRGQGAALLAISCGLFYTGPSAAASFVLIALTCGFSLIAHVLTARHHVKNVAVMEALGDIKSMYLILAINLIVGVAAVFVWIERASLLPS